MTTEQDARNRWPITMVAYVDDFRLIFCMTLICIPMLLFMRKPRRAAGAEPLNVPAE